MLYGIDVSEHNGKINWSEIKRSGIDFVIIRCSYGKHEDSNFRENVYHAYNVGLKVGAYHYSYALNENQALEESKFVANLIKESGCFLHLPIFLDMEDADKYKENHGFIFSRENVTDVCKAFIENIRLKYDVGLYSSYSWLKDFIDWKSLNCAVWSAQWASYDNFKGYIWQYTDSKEINGKIFDGNVMYEQGADF
jgi:GH25 family lysozyme M1 (1,4-beta-N-acetylmuramidase)